MGDMVTAFPCVVLITLATANLAKGLVGDAFYQNDDFPLNSKLRQRNVDTVEVSQNIIDGDPTKQISPLHIQTILPLDVSDSRVDIDDKPPKQMDRDTKLSKSILWTVWSDWSLCSRSCGGGVAVRTRMCWGRSSNYVTVKCPGRSAEHKLCNSKNCIGKHEDFRALQCSLQDDKLFQSTKFEWIPYAGREENPCDLSCMAVDHHFYHTFGTALDGTRCGMAKKNICIGGECVKVGCDLVVGSNIAEDACGVCGGNNSTCFHYKSVFDQLHENSAKDLDYNQVARIPIGATHVIVNEYTKNYLALLESDEHFDQYIINGNWVVSWPGHFEAAGSEVTYSRIDGRETFEIAGPTTKDLHIMILFLGFRPLVEFEYWLPNSLRPPQSSRVQEFRLQESAIQSMPSEDYYDQMYPEDLDFYAGEPQMSVETTTTKTSTTSTSPTTTSTTTTQPTTTTTTTLRNEVITKNKTKKKDRKPPRTGRAKPAYCSPCKRPTNRKRHFCESDFVVHARITAKRRLQRGRYVRYDVELLTTYKANFNLMHREYIWVPNTCCPKLRQYRHYLLMGQKVKHDVTEEKRRQGVDISPETRRYETRLFVNHTNYWHPWKKPYESKMAKISKNLDCKKILNRSSHEKSNKKEGNDA